MMKVKAGIWIDHRRAVIVLVTNEGERTTEIQSNAERQPGRSAGVRSTDPFEAQQVRADDSRQRDFTQQLQRYYDKVIAWVHSADAILIFGPGEAKGELRKRLELDKPDARIRGVETNDWMTERAIVAKVREQFPSPPLENAA